MKLTVESSTPGRNRWLKALLAAGVVLAAMSAMPWIAPARTQGLAFDAAGGAAVLADAPGSASVAPTSTDQANRLFVAATLAFRQATQASDPADAIALYREAVAGLHRIVENHPETELAVRLVSGQRIGTVALADFEAALTVAERAAGVPGNGQDRAAAPVTECDRLAAFGSDPGAVAEPVAEAALDAGAAVAACRAALADHPGEPRLEFQLARGLAAAGDDRGAMLHVRAAAALGYSAAQVWLAERLAEGRGTPRDLAEAEHWYTRAADRGDVAAQHGLGVLLRYGHGGERDADAAAWLRAAAEQGHAPSQIELGYLLEQSASGEGGLEQAARWYGRAAAQGDAMGQALLARLLYEGRGVAADPVEAVRLAALAAVQGNNGLAGGMLDALPREDLVRAAQTMLDDGGFDPGPVDGEIGGRTRRAIERFQAVIGRPIDGAVTPALLADLAVWPEFRAAEIDRFIDELSVLLCRPGGLDCACVENEFVTVFDPAEQYMAAAISAGIGAGLSADRIRARSGFANRPTEDFDAFMERADAFADRLAETCRPAAE